MSEVKQETKPEEQQQPTQEEVKQETKQEETIDDLPELEEAPQKTETKAPEPEKKTTRQEKKTKKAMAKLGLNPVSGVKRVQIRQKQAIFVIDDPEVYSAGDTYVVLGQIRMEDLQRNQLQEALKNLAKEKLPEEKKEEEKKEEVKEEEEEGEIDETGLEAKDIELVMKQANVSRGKAVKALREAKGDIVNAIMNLTI